MSGASRLIALLVLAGCASTGAGKTGAVAVTDLQSVVGRWVGLTELPGRREDAEYIEVTLHEDGTYQAKSARTSGFMDAHGRVALSDGKLLVQGDRGATGAATLLNVNGTRTLQVDMISPNGARTTGRLQPQP